MLPEKIRRYILTGLEATPLVLLSILGGFDAVDPVWDRRPDPIRFTLREALAHVADWDEIFLVRMQRTLVEEHPVLPDMDEGLLAAERDYAHQSPIDNLRRFAANRAKLVGFLRGLDEPSLARTALRPELGVLSIEEQMLMILGHDGYHTKQAAEFTALESS